MIRMLSYLKLIVLFLKQVWKDALIQKEYRGLSACTAIFYLLHLKIFIHHTMVALYTTEKIDVKKLKYKQKRL